jgi:hypothetical protein
MLQIFLICTPFKMNWNPMILGGRYASYNVAFATIGIFSMVTDLIIMLLPIPFIRKLQMATGTKLGLVAIVGIGLLCVPLSRALHFFLLVNSCCSVTAIAIVRINVLLDIDFTDLSFSVHDAAFWSVVEPAIAITSCCIATLRPLLKLISPARLWSSNKFNTSYLVGYSGSIVSGNKLEVGIGVEHDEYLLTCVEHEAADVMSVCGKREGSLGVKGDADSETSERNVLTADSVSN